MATTTVGVKIDEDLRARLKDAAESLGRTPHALIKQSIALLLDRWEQGLPMAIGDVDSEAVPMPFLAFARGVGAQSVLRAAITAAYRRPEEECLPLLLASAALPAPARERATKLAQDLALKLRAKNRRGGVEGLIQEYALSSQEGIALMCLAEALLRIPDRATRDALIRDKIKDGNWQAHLGQSPSMFVNAATWGLVVTGKLTTTNSEAGLSSALGRLIGKGGEPLIRKGVDMAMRMMGEQFVTGQTIAEALANSRRLEARGFRYSYDMLGEAATTAADAARYYRDYEQAIHAIGKASGRRGIYEGPGISIKLSALHPRYGRSQRHRVMEELLPRLKDLILLARRYDIGINIDAEESDRLELSLDLLEGLCFDPDLAEWNGIGFVVQAYQKRCTFVLDYLIDLARRSSRRLMIRLVKGAYWDSEIKRAQVDGLEGFPVFTRKVHTDVSYLACARKLLGAPDAVFPQFATHNAQTLAAIHTMAGENYYAGQYEFQCLHGMGEVLYEEVVGREKLNRPCRIYAPVGTHETLLAYLVRRLLENGANTSFVNRIGNAAIPIETLVADPVAEVQAQAVHGMPHPAIALPRDLYGDRANAAGLDLSNEQRLASLAASLLGSAELTWQAAPLIGEAVPPSAAGGRAILNPADHHDVVGHVLDSSPEEVEAAMAAAFAAAPIWQSTPPSERAACLERAAELLEARMPVLMGLIVREAGKSLANAVAEVREAVDFLRYYALQARTHFSIDAHRPLGPVVCISPWNFPLAIFTGQVAAALAAGNPVLAKPAEETPLIAAQSVAILREAGILPGAVQLLPGDGEIGAALVAHQGTRAVMFTGSTGVARAIQRQLAARLSPEGRPIPLIAETGGQNALIVDSSALAEQVVADVLVSAFDSAGQRCSALRLLCVQDDIADRLLTMLKGAMDELSIGNPDRLETDIGPVIAGDAKQTIEAHIAAMRASGHPVHSLVLPEGTGRGTFVAPTLIEIERVEELETEVFGPVLHVLRYRRADLDHLVDAINATGYGLTFGIHSRIDETITRLIRRIEAGNIYVNRNIVGAVVGVQPFGGHGLSGTGPKAGGPLYMRRLLATCLEDLHIEGGMPDLARSYLSWLGARERKLAERLAQLPIIADAAIDLAGPVGERNSYELIPRSWLLCLPRSEAGFWLQLGAAFLAGARVEIILPSALAPKLKALPPEISSHVTVIESVTESHALAVLFEGPGDELAEVSQALAALDGPIRSIFGLTSDEIAGGSLYRQEALILERSISINTAAAGGNASLMSIG
ncbi:L-proline dehydrogenase /delta-1-pyrroline-5-carboxylate dehydrogenase [Arboricoccus pini]|uniref:Bifunctional protein PutA n=1 Tax=Arboricoccus pini TaxID=1963835 RepID=A0A212RCL4_9PROT|nr:trifunctional transcriptional regulator/proline dehydrogenase/L-glutamate gamma-semialdehyde dehydrogenase [Arboricoccus pini]SNB69845.1 L-proline dehydrogenase /delta-1-pyrroline-5-carboxylate dehydrogenase [Arboricoccus pini]